MSKDKKKSKLKKINAPPKLDPKQTDGGDDTGRNFDFQYLCGAMISVTMLINKIKLKELYCELYEDFIGVTESNKLVGIQIKHRDASRGSFPILDKTIKHVLKRFVELDAKHPSQFHEFVIISDAYVAFNDKLFHNLSTLCKNNPHKLPDDAKKIIQKLSESIKCSDDVLIQIISKTSAIHVESRKSLESIIMTDTLSQLPKFKHASIPQLTRMLNILVSLVKIKSKPLKDSLSQYVAFLNDEYEKLIDDPVLEKRITKEEIQKIIDKGESQTLFKFQKKEPLTIGSYGLIRKKMSHGKIGNDEINSMELLVHNTNEFVLENYHKTGDPEQIKRMENMQISIATISADCETKAKSVSGNNYGISKLELIEQKLHQIDDAKPPEFDNLEYRLLKGLAGILMTRCRISFSPPPRGGWI